jgi:Flp pilus assembly protein TadD
MLPPWPGIELATARIEMAAGQDGEAVEAVGRAATLAARATRLDPGDPQAWLHLGRYQLLLGQRADAARSFESALSLVPTLVPAMNALGLVSQLDGNETGARTWYARSLDAAPGQPTIAAALKDLRMSDDV